MVPESNETITLCDFITNLKVEDVPGNVLEHLKRLILDTVGCGLFGTTIRSAKIVAGLVDDWGGKEEATVWGTNIKLPAANAAFANAVAVESHELDDVGQHSGHAGGAAVSAALAVAEKTGSVSGKDFLAAVLAGFELKARIHHAAIPVDEGNRKGFHNFTNSFPAAAAAGRILGLDTEKMAYTLCMAASQVAGLYHTTMVKRIHIGWLTHGGVISALLVQRGLLGVTDILERRWGGFYNAYYAAYDRDTLIGNLGKEYRSMTHGFKYSASCGSKITTLHAVRELRKQNPILYEQPEKIDKILIYASDLYRRWSGVDTAGASLIKVDEMNKAMMSAPYIVAVALLMEEPGWLGVDGKELPYTEKWINDPVVQKVCSKVEIIPDRLFNDPVGIEIRLGDGRTFSTDASRYRRGHPENPMTKEEIYRKFRNLATYRVSDARAEEIIKRVETLEEMKDVNELALLLS